MEDTAINNDLVEINRLGDQIITSLNFTSDKINTSLVCEDLVQFVDTIRDDVIELISRQDSYIEELEAELNSQKDTYTSLIKPEIVIMEPTESQEVSNTCQEVSITWTAEDVREEAANQGYSPTDDQISCILYGMQKLSSDNGVLTELVNEHSTS